MNESAILRAVEKTGFPLEHRVSTLFSEAGWTVVPNKYYVDDISGQVREIDLLAYRAAKVEGVYVYSTVIVSCKKAATDVWAFLTRESNRADPNRDYCPLHYWTNDKVIDYGFSRPGFNRTFNEELAKRAPDLWGVADKEIFGFQELEEKQPSQKQGKDNKPAALEYAPRNQTAIFSSLSSLMKAQSYELGRLPERRRDKKYIYIFSLLSVLDGKMVDVSYNKAKPKVSSTQIEQYVAHYILGGREQFCRINFICVESLPDIVQGYTASHREAVKQVRSRIDWYYQEAYKSEEMMAALLPEFAFQMRVMVNIFLEKKGKLKEADIGLQFNAEKECLEISIGIDSAVSAVDLNNCEKVIVRSAGLLKKFYKYEGPFTFVEDFPF